MMFCTLLPAVAGSSAEDARRDRAALLCPPPTSRSCGVSPEVSTVLLHQLGLVWPLGLLDVLSQVVGVHGPSVILSGSRFSRTDVFHGSTEDSLLVITTCM